MVLEGQNPWELLSLPALSFAKLGWSEDILAKFGKKKLGYKPIPQKLVPTYINKVTLKPITPYHFQSDPGLFL